MISPVNEDDERHNEVVDWDEKETQLALFNSRYVQYILFFILYSSLYSVVTPLMQRILQKDQGTKLWVMMTLMRIPLLMLSQQILCPLPQK